MSLKYETRLVLLLVGSLVTLNTFVFTYIYMIYKYISIPHKVLKSCRSKMGITHIQSLPCYHQNGFVATQAHGHMMYVMCGELLNRI